MVDVAFQSQAMAVVLGSDAQVAMSAAIRAEAAASTAQGLANFRATFAEAIAAFSVGDYFTCTETGTIRMYKRTSVSPFYADQGDAAVPASKANTLQIADDSANNGAGAVRYDGTVLGVGDVGSVPNIYIGKGNGTSVPLGYIASDMPGYTGGFSFGGTLRSGRVRFAAYGTVLGCSFDQDIYVVNSKVFHEGNLDTDNTLSANSDSHSASQKAVKGYVDNKLAGLSWKIAVRAATTANGALATAFAAGQVIDGVTLATGDRILLKNQTTASENGIYVVNASGAPTRASDADSGPELVNATVYISEGSTLADQQWTCSTNGPITLGTTGLTFVISNSGGGTTTNSITFNSSGSGAASGTAFNGAAPYTISYNTIGAAPLASPAFTGNPTAPTPSALDNDTSVATTAFVQSELMPSVQSTASTATFTPVAGVAGDDAGVITALAANLTINAPSGTPVQMQPLILRIKDNGTTRTLTWNAIYRIVGTTLPTTTVVNKTLYVGFLYNATDSKWDCVMMKQEA